MPDFLLFFTRWDACAKILCYYWPRKKHQFARYLWTEWAAMPLFGVQAWPAPNEVVAYVGIGATSGYMSCLSSLLVAIVRNYGQNLTQ